jgi:hypothetical protein
MSLCISQTNIITNQQGGNQLIGLCFADDTGTPCNPQEANSCFDGVCIDRLINNNVLEGRCTLRCLSSSDCAPDHACGAKLFNVDGQTQVLNVCIPVGDFCEGTGPNAADQCFSGVCLTDDMDNNRGYCSSFCTNDSLCPSSWECVSVDAENSVCLPR